jgi:hypothetical protein
MTTFRESFTDRGSLTKQVFKPHRKVYFAAGSFNDVCNITQYKISKRGQKVNDGSEWKRLWPDMKYFTGNFLEVLRTTINIFLRERVSLKRMQVSILTSLTALSR